jgi:hypothetical protein
VVRFYKKKGYKHFAKPVIQKIELGEVVYTAGSHRICSNGISCPGAFMKWEDVNQIYVGGSKSTTNLITPSGEEMKLTLKDSTGRRISFGCTADFLLGRRERKEFTKIYQFILSKISERQWKQFTEQMKGGRRVSFNTFDIAPDAIYYKSFWGKKVFELSRVRRQKTERGTFFIYYVNNDGTIKEQRLGAVEKIPNVHIAELFISSIIERKGGL